MRILLVEDDAILGDGIHAGLKLAEHAVDWVRDGEAARLALLDHPYDACVLDLGLPDGDGIALLQGWRTVALDVPVLILSARSTLEDKVAGFEGGGDDYLTKPFDLQELALRLRALLRRAAGRASDRLVLGDCEVRMDTAEVWRGGTRVDISRREWALLAALLQAHGRTLTPAQLHDSLYGFDLDVGSNTVNVHVHHLRRKLGADSIETVRGVGFRLGRSA